MNCGCALFCSVESLFVSHSTQTLMSDNWNWVLYSNLTLVILLNDSEWYLVIIGIISLCLFCCYLMLGLTWKTMINSNIENSLRKILGRFKRDEFVTILKQWGSIPSSCLSEVETATAQPQKGTRKALVQRVVQLCSVSSSIELASEFYRLHLISPPPPVCLK